MSLSAALSNAAEKWLFIDRSIRPGDGNIRGTNVPLFLLVIKRGEDDAFVEVVVPAPPVLLDILLLYIYFILK